MSSSLFLLPPLFLSLFSPLRLAAGSTGWGGSGRGQERRRELKRRRRRHTLSSLSGKRGAPSAAAAAVGGSDDEDSDDGSRKKLRLSKDQAAVLEDTFNKHNTLNPKQKAALARQLNLKPRQVEV
uniref:Homeobox domain containing protein n=1 Tax=Oryza sativa subsp. japonica TaxID=39947 RepID=Q7XCK2_ORYSJ|nr:Homeobox domain containing protein [Oryza sativa Japonica Group]